MNAKNGFGGMTGMLPFAYADSAVYIADDINDGSGLDKPVGLRCTFRERDAKNFREHPETE